MNIQQRNAVSPSRQAVDQLLRRQQLRGRALARGSALLLGSQRFNKLPVWRQPQSPGKSLQPRYIEAYSARHGLCTGSNQ